MTTYNGKINLFDCATAQKVIGQETFLNAFKTVLDHGAYCQGPETRELEEKLAQYSGTKYCATNASGTDAQTLALMAWDVKPGDAVFVRLRLSLLQNASFCLALRRFLLIRRRTRLRWIRQT